MVPLALHVDYWDYIGWKDSYAKREFALYESQLRPLISDADVYHVSGRPDGVHWDGIRYFDPRIGAGCCSNFAHLKARRSFTSGGSDALPTVNSPWSCPA